MGKKKFSDLDATTSLGMNDLLATSQVDAQATSGYTSKKITAGNIAKTVNDDFSYATELPSFTDKTITGGLEELKADIKALLPIDTASGNPCNFETGIADALVSLKATILASGGGGTPSTPIPIVGISSLDITRCGINVWEEETSDGYWNDDGSASTDNRYIRNKNLVLVTPATQYYFKCPSEAGNLYIKWYDRNGVNVAGSSIGKNSVFTVPANAYYLGFAFLKSAYGSEYGHDISINYPSTDTSYHAYNGQTFTIPLGQTVYGGVLDVKNGSLMVTWAKKMGSEITWNYDTDNRFYGLISGKANGEQNIICSDYEIAPIGSVINMPDLSIKGNANNAYVNIKNTNYGAEDLTAFRTSMANVSIAYEIATPIEITGLTPTDIQTLLGVNNISSDVGGDVEVSFRDSIQNYIDKKIAQTQALIL